MNWLIDYMTDWLIDFFLLLNAILSCHLFVFANWWIIITIIIIIIIYFLLLKWLISCSYLGESIFDPMTRKEIRGIQRKLCKIKVIVQTKLTSVFIYIWHLFLRIFLDRIFSLMFIPKQCSRMHWFSHLDRIEGVWLANPKVFIRRKVISARKVALPSQKGDRARQVSFLPEPTLNGSPNIFFISTGPKANLSRSYNNNNQSIFIRTPEKKMRSKWHVDN